jgi:chromosome segregation ATPase
VSQCHDVSKRVADLESELESEKKRVSSLLESVLGLEENKRSIEETLGRKTMHIEVIENWLAESKAEHQMSSSSVDELKALLATKEEQCVDLTERTESLETQLENEKKRVESLLESVSGLDETNASLDADVKRKSTELEKGKAKLFDLMEELSMNASKIKGLEVILADEEAHSKDLSTQLESVKAELKSEQCRIYTLGEDVSKLEETKSSLEGELTQKTAEVEEMKTKLAEASQDIIAKSARLNEFEELVAAKVAENEELDAQVKVNIGWMAKATNLERQIHQTGSDLFLARSQNEELCKSVTKLTKELATAHKEVRQYETRAKAVEKWVSSFSMSMQGWKESQELLEDGVEHKIVLSGSHTVEMEAQRSEIEEIDD